MDNRNQIVLSSGNASNKIKDNARTRENKNDSFCDASEIQTLPADTVGFDHLLNASLKEMVMRAEQPMVKGHSQIYAYLVKTAKESDEFFDEYVNKKKEWLTQLKLYEEEKIIRDQKIEALEQDRNNWKNKAAQFGRTGEDLKTENNDHLSTIKALKEKLDKLTTNKTELECMLAAGGRKFTNLEKLFEEQSQELKKCQVSTSELVGKIQTLEQQLKDEKANNTALLTQLNNIESEKKNLENKLGFLSDELRQMTMKNKELEVKAAGFQEKSKCSEDTISKLVAEEMSHRADPSILMNQLLLLLEKKNEQPRDFSLSESTIVEGNLGAIQRKRGPANNDGAAAAEKATEKIKKRKSISAAAVGGISEQETGEEGEIVDQQPQKTEIKFSTPSLVVASPSVVAGPPAPLPCVNRGGGCVINNIPTIPNPNVVATAYRPYNYRNADSNAPPGRGRGNKQRYFRNR